MSEDSTSKILSAINKGRRNKSKSEECSVEHNEPVAEPGSPDPVPEMGNVLSKILGPNNPNKKDIPR